MTKVTVEVAEYDDLQVDRHGLAALCNQVGKMLREELISCPLDIYGDEFAKRCNTFANCETCLMNWAQTKGAKFMGLEGVEDDDKG